MKTIPLSQGKVALVDDEDFERLSHIKWFVSTSCNHDYAATNIRKRGESRKFVKMHRLIMNASADQEIDHKDGDGLNNQKENLRFCTRSQNGANKRLAPNTQTGFKGVHFIKWNKNPTKPWRAMICVRRKVIVVGAYETCREAAIAYNEAAVKYFGEFAKLNTI